MTRQPSAKRRRAARHSRSAAEYFLAAVGLAMIVIAAAVLATAKSCSFSPTGQSATAPGR